MAPAPRALGGPQFAQQAARGGATTVQTGAAVVVPSKPKSGQPQSRVSVVPLLFTAAVGVLLAVNVPHLLGKPRVSSSLHASTRAKDILLPAPPLLAGSPPPAPLRLTPPPLPPAQVSAAHLPSFAETPPPSKASASRLTPKQWNECLALALGRRNPSRSFLAKRLGRRLAFSVSMPLCVASLAAVVQGLAVEFVKRIGGPNDTTKCIFLANNAVQTMDESCFSRREGCEPAADERVQGLPCATSLDGVTYYSVESTCAAQNMVGRVPHVLAMLCEKVYELDWQAINQQIHDAFYPAATETTDNSTNLVNQNSSMPTNGTDFQNPLVFPDVAQVIPVFCAMLVFCFALGFGAAALNRCANQKIANLQGKEIRRARASSSECGDGTETLLTGRNDDGRKDDDDGGHHHWSI
eukprot:GHVT01090270.1.p1 GENE.GHVT01090270.1~~GHVT01090270.1.p1  ORF type:complete len:410 (+),score=62.23 GHVT01090270.1:476-1705(+)